VIQSRIISSGQFQNLIPQFGAFVRLDYGWFAIHHLTIVSFTLLTGLSFSTQERILTVLLSVVFFLGFYQFTKSFLGNPLSFASSLFFLLVPRTYSYLANVNGEFIAWLILFPSLISFFAFVNSGQTKHALLSCFLASALIVANLMVFAEYLLIVGSYFIARTILSRDTKNMIGKMAIFLVVAILVVPLPVLVTSGNLIPGTSSTIGSLYSSRSPVEAQYEAIYYQNYDWGWKVFASQMPLQVQLFYISNDGYYASFLLLFFVPFAALGVISCILEIRKIYNLFALTWLLTSVLSSSLLLSHLFNVTVIAGSVRLLLYFAWPFSLMAGTGLVFLWKRARRRSMRPLLGIVLIFLIVDGIYVGSLSAGLSNAEPRLYLREYQDALVWLHQYSATSDVIMMNDWTVGQVWLESSRLSITESGVGSASYSTYQDIVTKLNDAATILISNSTAETVALMQKHNISWVVLWNRPSALNIVPYEQVNIAKFLNSSSFTETFSEENTYTNVPNNPFPSGTFTARVVIFHLNLDPNSFQEFRQEPP
jgi:4-amino-4-deoxy-L-arabinose transferase-like glycosyltransferase